MTAPPCPECVQGKHGNCDGTSWDVDTDESAPCPCPHPEHRTRRAVDGPCPKGGVHEWEPINAGDPEFNPLTSPAYATVDGRMVELAEDDPRRLEMLMKTERCPRCGLAR